MKKWFVYMFITLFINSYPIYSQDSYSVDKWMEYVRELAAETRDSEQIENLFADLSYLQEHPFDLNTVTEKELKRLPFLSDQQIEQLLSYRGRYGKMLSIYELKNVKDLDFQTISLILPFVHIGDQTVEKRALTVKNLFKYGDNELQIRYDRGFQQKKGYQQYADSVLQQYPNRTYLGEPFYHSLRYSYQFDDRLQIGFVGEKDMGEPFWNTYHKGYDFYSAHFFLRDINKLKSLAIGDYKVSFGQGLVISNDFSPSRSAIIAQAERRTNGFRRHFSTNEKDFFRGVATTLSFNQLDLSLFYSYRKMDAAVDSMTFTSLKTDGLHRLRRDVEKRRTVQLQTVGGNLRFALPTFHIGLTTVYYSFGNYRQVPYSTPYNLFYFNGSDNINISVDYMLKTRKVKFYGETAMSRNKAMATLNALQLTPVSYLSLLILYRYYDKRYQSLFGNAFSQSSTVQNEQGVYMGLQWVPFAHWKLSLYADVFRFPWLKYGIDLPSTGKEYMVQLDFTPSKNYSTYVRFKYRQKEKNMRNEKDNLFNISSYSQHRIRFQQIYNFSSPFLFKTSFDGILQEEQAKNSKGMMVAQHFGWKPTTLPFQTDLYVAWFHTDDYFSRIYSYEKNILYAFNMPSFYGEGIRLAFTFRLELLKSLTLSAKLAHTHYFDRDLIGTELEEINSSHKTDLYALLRWKF